MVHAATAKDTCQPIEYLASAICDAALLYVFNNLLNWRVAFVTADFTKTLAAFNIAFGAAIIFNIIFLCRPPIWSISLGKAISSAMMLGAIGVLYRVFPFAFADAKYDTITRIAIIIAACGTAIAIVVESVKFIIKPKFKS